jgi:hypothetical protein
MQKYLANLIIRAASVTTAFIAALALVGAASAWTSPPASPPANNAWPPLTVGSVTEIKSGGAGEGILALLSIVADRMCIGSACHTTWAAATPAAPNCEICVRAGVHSSSGYGEWVCAAFNGGYASSGAESSGGGRGTTVEFRVQCS